MKRSLLPLLLLCFTVTKAQLLKLKKNQKFSYEMSQSRFSKSSQQIPDLYYKNIDFEVIKASRGKYLLKVTEPLIITAVGGKITNTSLAIDDQELSIAAVTNKVLSTSTYFVSIDDQANITGVTGIAPIKDTVLARLKSLNLEIFFQDQQDMNWFFTDYGFKSHLESIFPNAAVQKKDSTSTRTGEGLIYELNKKGEEEARKYKISDTSSFKQDLHREAKTGLLLHYSLDTMRTRYIYSKGYSTYERSLEKVNLSSANIAEIAAGQILLQEISQVLKLDEYDLPASKAARRLERMMAMYRENKGRVGIDKEMLQQLEVLDPTIAATDYRYWALRMDLAGYTNEALYERFYPIVPYEYLISAFHVIRKMELEYQNHHAENLNKGLEMLFTKFPEEELAEGYPFSMDMLQELVHGHLAKDLFKSTNQDEATRIFDLIKGTENLKIAKVNGVFAALKGYTSIKLASREQDLMALAAVNLNGKYDKHSRYRLLSYDELKKKHLPDTVTTAYLDYTISQIKRQLADSSLLEELSLNRKYLADAYYRKSLSDKKNRMSYLSLASDYMPDLYDRTHDNGELALEYRFLPEINYTELLIAQSGDGKLSPAQRLERQVDLVILEPQRYAILKDNYQKAFPNGDFKAFFNKTLKAKLPAIPEFELREISGKKLSNKDQQGKFIFIDFWGTWCGVCVDEIHKIDSLYRYNKQPEKLIVTTIACFNSKEDVAGFMKAKKYSYPVLMSDGNTHRNFKIRTYPTKLLLLPNGVYLDIPFSEDYQVVLDKYLVWDLN